jgi:hypothetical protein
MDISQETQKQLLDWVQQAGNFVKEQAPKAVQDLLTAKTISSSIWICSALVIIPLSIFLYKKYKEAEEDLKGPFLFCMFVSILSSWLIFTTNLYYILIVHYAPRAYLLEYFGVTK